MRHENLTPPATPLAFSTHVTILNHTDLPESSKHIIELTVNSAVKIMHVSTFILRIFILSMARALIAIRKVFS